MSGLTLVGIIQPPVKPRKPYTRKPTEPKQQELKLANITHIEYVNPRKGCKYGPREIPPPPEMKLQVNKEVVVPVKISPRVTFHQYLRNSRQVYGDLPNLSPTDVRWLWDPLRKSKYRFVRISNAKRKKNIQYLARCYDKEGYEINLGSFSTALEAAWAVHLYVTKGHAHKLVTIGLKRYIHDPAEKVRIIKERKLKKLKERKQKAPKMMPSILKNYRSRLATASRAIKRLYNEQQE